MRKPKDGLIQQIYGSEAEKVSLHIYLRYVFDENNRWKLHVIVDEMTTAEELRNAWGSIDIAREELKLWQGTDPNWYSVVLLLDLEQRKNESSYGDLAMDMNFDTLVYLLWASDQSKGTDRARAGEITFINHMKGLGFKNEVIRDKEEQGRSALANGKLPWKLKEGPIKSQRITDALIQFKKAKKSKKIVITETMNTDQLVKFRICSLIYRYWIQARDLLIRWDPDYDKLYKDRWISRTKELLRKNNEFSGLTPQ